MPAQLVALNEGPNILVDKPILLLGRHPECDIQIESRKISRRHCCIAQVNDYLVVRDLDSTNGVRINGVRVIYGRLQAGDELTVGNHRYQVIWGDEPPRPRVVHAAGSAPGPLRPWPGRCPARKTTNCSKPATSRWPCPIRDGLRPGLSRRPGRPPRLRPPT